MFSGIIEHKAKILNREGGRFFVENTFDASLNMGQSIAHDGACMTLTNITNDSYEFFVMEESLSLTNFGNKEVGDYFNVERSLKLGDRIDGHMVSGHIDTVGKVIQLTQVQDGSLIFRVSFDVKFLPFVIRKGSITLNGVSLTIVEVFSDGISVSLIPLTQDWTNLGTARVGDIINIEFDMMAKYVSELMKNYLQP